MYQHRLYRVSCRRIVYIVCLEFVPAFEISWRHRSEIWILLLNSVTIFRWSIVARKVEMGQYFWYTSVEKKEGIERDKCFVRLLVGKWQFYELIVRRRLHNRRAVSSDIWDNKIKITENVYYLTFSIFSLFFFLI